tara:strand:- start:613 stop:828 length:216 start_codon:yes stop_codon:yes gene_type:complete
MGSPPRILRIGDKHFRNELVCSFLVSNYENEAIVEVIATASRSDGVAAQLMDGSEASIHADSTGAMRYRDR